MFKIKIFTIGKTKESWLSLANEEYHKRLKHQASIEWILCKGNDQLTELLEKESSWICLDPTGKTMTSQEFSLWFFKELEREGSRLNIVIGGAEGIPSSIKSKSKGLISLSKLTFTHQITRLILLEQIYRAFEIQKGSEYHK